MTDYTLNDVMGSLASLRSEVRELRRLVEAGQRGVVVEQPQHVTDDERGVFLPGTGWTESNAPQSDGPPVPFNEAAERAREAREQLRKGPTT